MERARTGGDVPAYIVHGLQGIEQMGNYARYSLYVEWENRGGVLVRRPKVDIVFLNSAVPAALKMTLAEYPAAATGAETDVLRLIPSWRH